MLQKPLAVAIVSGGLDSTVLAYKLRAEGYKLHMISCNYGQRHVREIDYARMTASKLDGAQHSVVDLRSITALLRGSALTDASVPVPDGHYAADSMKATIVPNRNAIMLSIAWGIAVADKAAVVAAGMHSGDHFIYPDCRPLFLGSFQAAMHAGNEGFGDDIRLYTPFIGHSKAGIVREGRALGVPFVDTYSCYKGGATHCGTCGTCVERREAFVEAHTDDPTMYLSYEQFGAPV